MRYFYKAGLGLFNHICPKLFFNSGIRIFKKAVKFYLVNTNESLISAYRLSGVTKPILYTKNDKIAVPVLKGHIQGIRRQEAREIYVRNGAIYLTPVAYLKKHKKIISEKPLLFEMPKERSLNIDEPEDLEKFRKYINNINKK